ncbi:hypothetical protein NDU88_001113 [Pleurodeles waltl]|uniref:Uncharacterized protein n=1 Tax=Pleurodeles waltl TaxID=8319 RepID=A0AAV7WL74_PLEWA|nr:hypothetical protein NDU88_001113 [Pleurodeles waltl]
MALGPGPGPVRVAASVPERPERPERPEVRRRPARPHSWSGPGMRSLPEVAWLLGHGSGDDRRTHLEVLVTKWGGGLEVVLQGSGGQTAPALMGGDHRTHLEVLVTEWGGGPVVALRGCGEQTALALTGGGRCP